jgi:hypothetical protein
MKAFSVHISAIRLRTARAVVSRDGAFPYDLMAGA